MSESTPPLPPGAVGPVPGNREGAPSAPPAYPAALGHSTPPSPMPYGYPAQASPVAQGTPASNGFAVASLVLGICGFVLMGIPFFIGLLFGGVPDILAVVFGIMGILRANRMGGRGLAVSVVGLVLGGLSLLTVPFGAGWLW